MRHLAAAVLAACLLWAVTRSPAGTLFAGAAVAVGLAVTALR